MIAVEKDARFLPLLEELAAAADGRLTIVEADALTVDEARAAPRARRPHVVSNLPYNVGTPLLIKWLTGPWPPHVHDPDVPEGSRRADRRRRRATTPTAAWRSSPRPSARRALVMDLPARAFTPPPKVDSAVVRLDPARRPPARRRCCAALERVTAAAFGQRRKMLRSSLKTLGGEALVRSAGIDPNARAETVAGGGFLRLAGRVELGASNQLPPP